MKPLPRENPVFAGEPMIGELDPSVRPAPLEEAASPVLVDLGLADYRQVYGLQKHLVEDLHRGTLQRETILVVEHPAVFTLGRRGGRQHLLVSEEFLSDRGVDLVHIERGGEITYHGPGQLVLYPIVELRRHGWTVGAYVELLEEIMLRLAAGVGVGAERSPRNHGIWVGNSKLGSVGIAIRHGCSFHGLAINVDPDLAPFSWIQPCGLSGVSMTSLVQEQKTGSDEILPSVAMLKTQLPELLSTLFGARVGWMDSSAAETLWAGFGER